MLAAIVLSAAAASAAAQPPVKLFGLFDLGAGPRLTRVCPRGTEDKVAQLCWLEAPKNYNGQRAGDVMLPHTETLPTWAEYGMFAVWYEGDVLQRVDVKFDAHNLSDALTSINSRFGKPTLVGDTGDWFNWDRADITIRLQCSQDRCHAFFNSPEFMARLAKEQAAKAKVDAARAKTP